MKYTQDIELKEGNIDLILLRLNDLSTYEMTIIDDQKSFNEDIKNLIALTLMEKGRQQL